MAHPATIDRFAGEYAFLSNFYRHPLVWRGQTYQTAEHAYQSAKAYLESERLLVCQAVSPAIAKAIGRRVYMRPDWDEVKDGIMEDVVRAKFRDIRIRRKLVATHPALLIEGNNWGDLYWGVCGGLGENKLGQILMKVRGEWVDKTAAQAAML